MATSSRQSGRWGLWPDRVKNNGEPDPAITLEWLRIVLQELRAGKLGPDARDYLQYALTAIRRGVPAERALYLTRRRGRRTGWRKKSGRLAGLLRKK